MTRVETKIVRKTIKMNALALAAAQFALLCGNAAHAQTDATKSDQATVDGVTTTVVVTGQRKQLETAAAIKRNSDLIVDSVVADEAGKLPDKSITEVLQRVVGVTMDRNRSRQGSNLAANGLEFNVEGSGIQVRGLSWGSSTLNGRETFSAGWPGRELSWGDVPPELMAGVDVYKNPSAELVEGGISGQVDLRTRLPFDAKGQYGALTATGNYAVLGKTKSPGFSGLYSNRWKTSMGEFGALVDLSVNKTKNRFDTLSQSVYYPRADLIPGKTAWVPAGVDWGTTTGKNQRTGIYGALQWKNSSMESSLTYFDSAFHETTYNSELSIFANSNYGDAEDPYKYKYDHANFDANGVFQSGIVSYPLGGRGANQFADGGLSTNVTQNYRDVHGRTRELAWNFKWRVNESWSFQNDLQWVHATNNGDYGMLNLGTYVPSMGIMESGSQPTFFFDDKARAFLADPRNYYWGISQPEINKAKADLYAWKLDGKYTFDHPVLRDFRFGARVTERSTAKYKNAGTGWYSYAQEWAVQATKVAGQLPDPKNLGWQRSNFGYMSDPRFAALGTVVPYTFPNFFNGNVSAPPTIIVPTMAMVQDKPNAYKNLIQALRYSCMDDNAIQGKNTDCASIGNDWRPEGYNDDPQNVSKHSEGTQTVHGTLRFGFDDWKYPVDGNVGVRVVRTNTTAHGYTVFKPQYSVTTNPAVPRFAEVNDPLDLKANHIDVLPSLNLKISLTDKLQSRLALSKGISRPGFDQMQEYITLHQNIVNDPDHTGQIKQITYTGENDGNVKLKPLKSNNFDVSLEWYPHPGQSLTAAVFYKQVKDIIMKETYTRTYKDLAGNDMDFNITGPANVAKANVRGVEIAGMTYLDHLPGLSDLPAWVKGFGVSSNFTYIDGKQQLYHPFKGNYCPKGQLTGDIMLFGCDTNGMPYKDLPVPYMSKRAFNLQFMYDQGPVSARLAYSWRDRTLLATGVYGASGTNGTSADPARVDANGNEPHDVGWGIPVWQEPVGQWDAGISYRFTEHFSGSFNASNLTRTVTKQTNQQAPGNMGRSWFDPGRSFRMQATYVF
jgi:TonB-dependent receptor